MDNRRICGVRVIGGFKQGDITATEILIKAATPFNRFFDLKALSHLFSIEDAKDF